MSMLQDMLIVLSRNCFCCNLFIDIHISWAFSMSKMENCAMHRSLQQWLVSLFLESLLSLRSPVPMTQNNYIYGWLSMPSYNLLYNFMYVCTPTYHHVMATCLLSEVPAILYAVCLYLRNVLYASSKLYFILSSLCVRSFACAWH